MLIILTVNAKYLAGVIPSVVEESTVDFDLRSTVGPFGRDDMCVVGFLYKKGLSWVFQGF